MILPCICFLQFEKQTNKKTEKSSNMKGRKKNKAKLQVDNWEFQHDGA